MIPVDIGRSPPSNGVVTGGMTSHPDCHLLLSRSCLTMQISTWIQSGLRQVLKIARTADSRRVGGHHSHSTVCHQAQDVSFAESFRAVWFETRLLLRLVSPTSKMQRACMPLANKRVPTRWSGRYEICQGLSRPEECCGFGRSVTTFLSQCSTVN